MKTIDPQISPEEDLSEILSKCLLIPRYGSRKFGTRFAIEISGRNPLRAKFGDLRLRIIPLVPLISGDPALLDVAKRGQQELTDDLNPGIATRARSELDRLSSPPLPAEVLQHRRIHLHQVGTSAQTVETDAAGEATFTDVELDRECSFSLELAKADPAMATGTTEFADRTNPAIDRTLALVAKSGTELRNDKLGQSHDETTPMPLRFERTARDPLRRAAANPEHELATCLTGAPMSGPIRVSDLTITNEAGAASFAESVLLEIRAGVAHFTIPAGLSVKLDDCPYTHGEELRKDLAVLSRMRVEFFLDEISGPMLVFLPLPTN
jgi:hypothetical protein